MIALLTLAAVLLIIILRYVAIMYDPYEDTSYYDKITEKYKNKKDEEN